MKRKNYFIAFYSLLVTFLYVYTLNISLDLTKQLNFINMIIMFSCFVVWLYSWYLFFVKDILKSDQVERNRISLVLVLLAIILFYYNPLPFPNNYYIQIDRFYYFIINIIFIISFIIIARKLKFFIAGILTLIPLTINNYFVNIQNDSSFFDKYPYFTVAAIIILLFSLFGYKQMNSKKK